MNVLKAMVYRNFWTVNVNKQRMDLHQMNLVQNV